ncbi:MAG TPA: flagellar export chaperone FlgN [Dongiaceae bacterium]|jgi:hypothetical protein|nr:flagellar export chaperone FlgN [Dongiaceae bacterium]
MKDLLTNLIDALREELKQYGEMLALLDQQQELVLERQTQNLLQNVAIINAQAETIHAARAAREQLQRHLARRLELPEHTPFGELAARLPAEYRPLVGALVAENNELLVRVQHRARQNHLLLSRVVELMQRFIGSILPGAGMTTTYTGTGQTPAGRWPQNSLYEAVG